MRRDGIQSADGHTYIHAYSHTDRQTDIHTWLHTYILTDRLTCKQSVPRHASNQALGYGIACNAMEIAAKQTLCEDEASLAAGLEAGLEAMEIAIDPMESALG